MISHLLICPDGMRGDRGKSFHFLMDFARSWGPNGHIRRCAQDAQRMAFLVARASCCIQRVDCAIHRVVLHSISIRIIRTGKIYR